MGVAEAISKRVAVLDAVYKCFTNSGFGAVFGLIKDTSKTSIINKLGNCHEAKASIIKICKYTTGVRTKRRKSPIVLNV